MYRIIAYTNSRVAQWNNHVRHMIIQDADKSLITRNDLIMSYTTVVNIFNDIIINNSEEYIVKDIVDTIDNDYEFKGFLIKFQAIHGGAITQPLFVIDHYDNYTFQMYYKKLASLIDDAKKLAVLNVEVNGNNILILNVNILSLLILRIVMVRFYLVEI